MPLLALSLVLLGVLLAGIALGMLAMLALLRPHITALLQRLDALALDHTRQTQHLAAYKRNGLVREP